MTRAQPTPVEPLDLADNHAYKPPKRDKVAKILLRFNPRIKEAVAEAASREGLSMNVWVTRVLAEAAKASRHGFISQPPDFDSDRMHPTPQAEPADAWPPIQPIQPNVSPTIYPNTGPFWVTSPNRTITGTGTSTSPGTSPTITLHNTMSSNASGQGFEFPDNDIPELT